MKKRNERLVRGVELLILILLIGLAVTIIALRIREISTDAEARALYGIRPVIEATPTVQASEPRAAAPAALCSAFSQSPEVRNEDTEPVETAAPLECSISSHLPEMEQIEPEPPEIRAVAPIQQVAAAPAQKLLESVPLDAETQTAIFDLCDHDAALFCTVMSIAQIESCFTPAITGDSGAAIGMMQIQPRWHWARMAELGIRLEDLADPVNNAAVAIAFLREIMRDYHAEAGSHFLFMAYNFGPYGALMNTDAGVYSSYYSRTAAATYEAYMQEMAEVAA